MTKDITRLDRHSATGVSGDPKKGGHLGWGKPGEEGTGPLPAAIDPKDPNYVDDDDEEENDS